MRGWELLRESEGSDFESDVEDLLIAAKANGMQELSVDALVDQLNDMGYAVTPDSLIASLEDHEHEHDFIKNITLSTIVLKSHSLDDQEITGFEDEEIDAERIASKTAMKGVKDKQAFQQSATKDAIA